MAPPRPGAVRAGREREKKRKFEPRSGVQKRESKDDIWEKFLLNQISRVKGDVVKVHFFHKMNANVTK
jgi:hypothetical protein